MSKTSGVKVPYEWYVYGRITSGLLIAHWCMIFFVTIVWYFMYAVPNYPAEEQRSSNRVTEDGSQPKEKDESSQPKPKEEDANSQSKEEAT